MSQFNLLQMVSQHKEHCLREVCNCKQENLYDDKHQLNIDLVMNIIDTVFRDCMQSKTATKNRAIREHLFLKYITFISKFQRNPLRSYYELKKYYKMYPKDNSSYFIGVCQVLAKTFKQMITANQELLYSTQKIEQRSTFNSKITLTIKEILKTFEIQNALVPLLSKYTQKKIQHFKQLKTSVSSMDTLRIISKDLYTKFMYLKHQFSQYSQSFSKITKLEPNFILQKIIIYNEVKKPLHLERQMMHLIQKGSARPMDELNSFNLIKGNIISIFTSVNQNYKILNQPNSSLTNFFGYNQIEFSSIKKIEDLMPPYISNIHSQLVNGFIHSGQSPFLSICNRVFSINKYGFIFPVNLQISINYSFQDDFRMSATLLKLISQKGYIVFNQSGSIKGIDKNFFSSFFDLKILEENENFQENTQNEDEQQSLILKEIKKINIFLFMPCLIKSVKEFLNQQWTLKENQHEAQQNNNDKQDDKNTILKSISRRLLFSKNDIKLEIPFNLIEINQSIEQSFQNYLQEIKFNTNQSQKGNNKQSSKTNSFSNKFDALNFFQKFYKTNKTEWSKMNCLKSLSCQANLIVHIINSSNQRHQHIVQDQEFIFELEINDLKENKQRVLNTKDLEHKLSNVHTQKENESENGISESANNTDFSSENEDSNKLKSFIKMKSQTSKELKTKRDSLINLSKAQNQNSCKLIEQNNSPENYQKIKTTSLTLVQPQPTKIESNKIINNTINVIDESSNKFLQKERTLEEEHNIVNYMSQMTSNRNLISQQELELAWISPRHFKSEENYHNFNQDQTKQDSGKHLSKTNIQSDKSINQLNNQTTQLITSSNNINSPISAQLLQKNYQPFEKSYDQKIASNNDSFQLIELFRKKSHQNQIAKNRKISHAKYQTQNGIQNQLDQQNTVQEIENIKKKSTPSRPTNNTDKQEKDEIKLDKQLKMENIHEGSSTTSSSSSRQNLIVYQIIHKRSIKSNFKIIFLLGQYYDKQALTSLVKYEYDLNMLPKELQSVADSFDQNFCNQISSNFQLELSKNVNQIIELSQTSDVNHIFTFSSNQKVSVEVRQLEFYLLSLEKIKAVCGQDPMNQTQINSIYFMYDNQLIIQSNSRGFIQKNIDKQNEIIDQLQLNIFLIAIVTSVVSVIASILTIPLMKSINKFQEIIYFVLSRTTFEEAEREISKLELFHKNLMDKDNSWIEYNFCSDFILERANNRINSKEGSITAHSTQASQISQRQKRISSKTQQQHISSKIRDQKLSFIKYFLQLSFFGLTAVCFLAASIIFFQQEKSYLKEQLEVFNTTMKTKLCFHSIITLSEITFRKDIIQQFDTNFPFDQYSEVISIFNKDLSILSSYTTYMSSAIQNKKIFENQHMSNLQKLFNSNLCDQFPDQELCSSSNQSTIKQQANNGFFSVISSYLNYFQQFNKLLQSRLSKDEITQLSWDYSSLDQYKYLIAQGFSLPVETFNLIQNQLYTLIVDLINLIQQFYTLYMVIGEITLIVIWLIFSAYLKQKINLDIQSAQFALTCLPFQKAQEETTIYLLKSIFKY